MLQTKVTHPYDDIWMRVSAEYPCMAVLTNGRQAVLTFFVSEGLFYCSVGDTQEEGTVSFIAGGQETDIAAYTVVSIEQAVTCAMDFFHTGSLPDCIEWEEL